MYVCVCVCVHVLYIHIYIKWGQENMTLERMLVSFLRLIKCLVCGRGARTPGTRATRDVVPRRKTEALLTEGGEGRPETVNCSWCGLPYFAPESIVLALLCR